MFIEYLPDNSKSGDKKEVDLADDGDNECGYNNDPSPTCEGCRDSFNKDDGKLLSSVGGALGSGDVNTDLSCDPIIPHYVDSSTKEIVLLESDEREQAV